MAGWLIVRSSPPASNDAQAQATKDLVRRLRLRDIVIVRRRRRRRLREPTKELASRVEVDNAKLPDPGDGHLRVNAQQLEPSARVDAEDRFHVPLRDRTRRERDRSARLESAFQRWGPCPPDTPPTCGGMSDE